MNKFAALSVPKESSAGLRVSGGKVSHGQVKWGVKRGGDERIQSASSFFSNFPCHLTEA